MVDERLTKLVDEIKLLMIKYYNLVEEINEEDDQDDKETLCITAIYLPKYGTWVKVIRDSV